MLARCVCMCMPPSPLSTPANGTGTVIDPSNVGQATGALACSHLTSAIISCPSIWWHSDVKSRTFVTPMLSSWRVKIKNVYELTRHFSVRVPCKLCVEYMFVKTNKQTNKQTSKHSSRASLISSRQKSMISKSM